MKYIRTSKSIYEVDFEKYEYIGKPYRTTSMKESELVLKEADTIEELCDEFVVVSINKKHTILPSNSFIDIVGATCYGAIWTDKGLIYVAKMNEKGELELLC